MAPRTIPRSHSLLPVPKGLSRYSVVHLCLMVEELPAHKHHPPYLLSAEYILANRIHAYGLRYEAYHPGSCDYLAGKRLAFRRSIGTSFYFLFFCLYLKGEITHVDILRTRLEMPGDINALPSADIDFMPRSVNGIRCEGN